MAQSRRNVRPTSSRLQHSALICARNPNKASMTLMLAAAGLKVVDALFGFLAQNPRIDLGFRDFFPGSGKMSRSEKIVGICATLNLEVLGVPDGLVHSIRLLEAPGVFLARRWRRC